MKMKTWLSTLVAAVTCLLSVSTPAVTLTATDPVTGETLCHMSRPRSDRIRLTADTNSGTQGLWFDFDGQAADGLRLSLVGASARNLILDATGSDISGAQLLLDGTQSTHVRVQARDADVSGLIYAISMSTRPQSPLAPVIEGWPSQQSPSKMMWSPIIAAGQSAIDRARAMGLSDAEITLRLANALKSAY